MGWTYGVMGETQITASRATSRRGVEVRYWTTEHWVVGSPPGTGLSSLIIIHVPTTGWHNLTNEHKHKHLYFRVEIDAYYCIQPNKYQKLHSFIRIMNQLTLCNTIPCCLICDMIIYYHVAFSCICGQSDVFYDIL